MTGSADDKKGKQTSHPEKNKKKTKQTNTVPPLKAAMS